MSAPRPSAERIDEIREEVTGIGHWAADMVRELLAEVDALRGERDEAEDAHGRMFDDVYCGLQTGPGEYCDDRRLHDLPRCAFHLPALVADLLTPPAEGGGE